MGKPLFPACCNFSLSIPGERNLPNSGACILSITWALFLELGGRFLHYGALSQVLHSETGQAKVRGRNWVIILTCITWDT